MQRLAFLLVGVVALSSLCIGKIPAQNASPGLTILSCIAAADASERPGITVSFRNDSSVAYSSIVWRAAFGRGWLDFTDKGDFAPGVVATHTLIWPRGFYSGYYRDNPANCSVVADGTAPTPDFSFPTPPPDNATPIPATFDNSTHDPIGIISCSLSVVAGRTHGLGRKAGLGWLRVRFRNLSTQTIDRVVLRAAYLSGGIDFTDGGSFAPNVLIKSDYQYVFGQRAAGRLYEDLPVATPVDYFSSDEDPSNCVTVSARYHDGTTWQNPDVGATQPPLPTAPPTLPPASH
ncbi:MAG TPA: hypothetical protein VNF68_08615 [Candidatus Baltobacteraceae bacterium]|nr:hypothetical protein [Candidatus Baltobacteraceae bacterium]